MNQKTDMPSLSGDAAVEWVDGPGRKPKLTPQDLMALSEEDRERIRQLIAKRKSLPLGPFRRRDQLRIGNAIALIRHPQRISKSPAAQKAKTKWLLENPVERLRVGKAYYYRTRKTSFIRVLSQSKIAIANRERRKNNPQFAIACRLRVVMKRALHRQFVKKSFRTFDLIGCSPEELRIHIERLFLPCMSWENRKFWHVDHKRPLSSFDLQLEAQQRIAFHFSNLQPLWAKDNMSKGAKY